MRELRNDILADPAKKATIVKDRFMDKAEDAKDELDDWVETEFIMPYNRKKEKIGDKIEDAHY